MVSKEITLLVICAKYLEEQRFVKFGKRQMQSIVLLVVVNSLSRVAFPVIPKLFIEPGWFFPELEITHQAQLDLSSM